jgi:hypothetical protein
MSRTSTKPAAKSNVVSIAPPKATKPRAISLELVIRQAPDQHTVENLTRTFGLDPVDFDGIRDVIGAQIRASGETLGEALNERALQIHLQRIVGAHVASAYGAAQFYGAKLSAAKDLTTRLGNDDRDEDRGGPSGFEDKAARARRFAAEMALQSYALRAAAEGAVLAYAEVTGETWKAYEAPAPASTSISRRGAAVEMAAFQTA